MKNLISPTALLTHDTRARKHDLMARVSLVEDDRAVREAMTLALTSLTHEVAGAPDGPSALAELAPGHRHEVVVLDVMMPGMDGFEVCRAVHETWTYASTLGSVLDLITSSARAWLLPWHLPLTLTVLAVTGGWVAARSGLLLAVVPSLLARGAYGNPALWGLGFHYNLLPQVVIAFAVVEALGRLDPLRARRALRLVLAGALVAAAVVPALRIAVVPVDATAWQRTVALTETVPASASLATGSRLTPVASLTHVHVTLLQPSLQGPTGRPVEADYVLVDSGIGWQAEAIDSLERSGYRTLTVDGPLVLLTRV